MKKLTLVIFSVALTVNASAQTIPKPSKPEALRSVESISEQTIKSIKGAGKSYCKSVETVRTIADLSMPACLKAIETAQKASAEVCNGAEFIGVANFDGLEAATVNLDYITVASKQFTYNLGPCGSAVSEIASISSQYSKSIAETYFRIDQSWKGQFQKLVGEGLSDADMKKLRQTWLKYAQGLYESVTNKKISYFSQI